MAILSTMQLSTGYGRETISEELSCSFEKGTITSIIGPNGCGKSTLLKTMARILPEIKGQVLLEGEGLSYYTSKEIARKLAMLSQNPESSLDLPVIDFVAFGRHPYRSGWQSLTQQDHQIIQWALEVTELVELAHESLAILSGGQRQRVWIALALVQDTDILLLDEPTTYLDPAHQLEILTVLQTINQQQQKTIVMTIHDINLASRFSDRIIAMKAGTVVKEGVPAEVITPEILAEVFSIRAEVVCHNKTQRPLMLSYERIDKEATHG